MIERKIEEVFLCIGELVKVVKDEDLLCCSKCVCFSDNNCEGEIRALCGMCHPAFRTDKTGVHFERIE